MKRNYLNLSIQKYMSIQKAKPFEDQYEFEIRRIGIVEGLTHDQVIELPYTELQKKVHELNRLQNDRLPVKLLSKVKIGSTWYKIDTDITQLRASQFIDSSTFSSDDLENNLHKFIACFLRPMTWRFGKAAKYDGTKHKQISEDILVKMTLEQAYPLMVFFCQFLSKLSQVIPIYLSQVLEKMKMEMEEAEKPLFKSGVGSPLSTT